MDPNGGFAHEVGVVFRDGEIVGGERLPRLSKLACIGGNGSESTMGER